MAASLKYQSGVPVSILKVGPVTLVTHQGAELTRPVLAVQGPMFKLVCWWLLTGSWF